MLLEMSEIVPVEPISHGRKKSSMRVLPRSRTVGYVAEPFDSEKLPPSLILEIRRFLRVANQIEHDAPRVAYLCRFHAFEKAHNLDPSSSARQVRQFKTLLLQRLERDEQATIFMRKEISDTRELKRFYNKYKDYICKHEKDCDSSEGREKLVTAHLIASVLFEVLKTVMSEGAHEILDAGKDIKYVPYNILPLDTGSAQQAVMQLHEIKAAVTALHNIRGLALSENHKPGNVLDLLDWLQYWFGFQRGNVSNQREHLILLLANIHIRQTPKPESIAKLDERAVDELMKKLLKNYMSWCKFLGRKSNIWLPSVKLEVQQYKILYISLYLLIWGEASNLRLMPECLCYIYHNMAYELYGLLSSATAPITGQKVVPVYGGEPESFLNNVITPIYKVIYEESQKNKSGTADHAKWRNYDDLNEYFWSPDCFQLGWPMRLDSNFFYTFSSNDAYPTTTNQVLCDHGDIDNSFVETSEDDMSKWLEKTKLVEFLSFWRLSVPALLVRLKEHTWKKKNESELNGPKWLGKTNFVEIRSFWHLFRSFDRMWTFFILALQVMIIMAWHGLRSPIELFDAVVLENILSIFITSAILKFIQAILDIVITWKARHTMNFFQKLRYVLKIVVAATWAIVLPINYARSGKSYSCAGEPYRSWVGEWRCFSPYIFTVAIYLVTNIIGMALFFVPALASYIETSNWRVLTILSWWAQPRLYVGRGMQESQLFLTKYTIFWVLLLISKLSFSYYFQIKPLVEPTKQIVQIGVSNYEWHELFPKVKRNAGAVVAVWAPVILVYFMDTQIWYAVFCTIFGGVYGVFNHLGEIRTMGMLRSRFQSLPAAFNVCLFPPNSEKEQKNVGRFFGQKVSKESENDTNIITRFSLVWNQIITSFRSEDLISNREMDLMIITFTSELTSSRVRWPVFLLATKFSTALNMAKDFVGKDQDLFKKIRKDNYVHSAVKECYESLKYILDLLVVGDPEKQ